MDIRLATLTQLTEQLFSNKKLIEDIETQTEQIYQEITERVRDNTDDEKVLVEVNNRFYLYTIGHEVRTINLIEVKKVD